jgi:uncharacterized protein involved in exopolysaccharide biosynthesis/Mrp family chromosome partitioning ATPase
MSAYRTMPAAYAAPPAPAFTAEDFLRLVQARKTLILRVAAGVFVLALLTALILPTVYASSAVVILDQRKNNVTDLSAVLSQLPADPATVQNEIQVLTSRDLAAQVVANLKLYNDPEFNPKLRRTGTAAFLRLLDPRNGPASATTNFNLHERDRVIDIFLKHLSAESIGLSTAITVTFRAHEAQKAARIANAVADAYVQGQIATKINATNSANQWLNKRTHDLEHQIENQEAAIQAYKAQNNLNDTGPGNSLADQQMAGISAQIVQARSDVAEKQATYDRVNALVKGGNTADVSEVVASPLISQLRAQEAELIRTESELSTKYGPLHPKMQAVEAQRRDLDAKITQEAKRVAGLSANSLAVAKAHLASLQGSLKEAENQAMRQNMARVKLQAMQADTSSTRTMYESFVSRLRSVQDQDQVQVPEGRVISRASVPLSPASPKRTLIVLASIPVGLLLGLLSALLAERFTPVPKLYPPPRPPGRFYFSPVQKGTVPPRTAGPVAIWNSLPILAEIPGGLTLRTIDHVIDWPQSGFSHAMGTLVCQLESRGHGAGVIALTAADTGESKAAIAVALARAAGTRGKKVVLLDSDLHNPLAARAMRAPITAGLRDVLSSATPLNTALAKDPRSNTFVLANYGRNPAQAQMFGSKEMARLIKILRENCDLVIIDSGNALAGPESALLARLADATVLITRREIMGTPQTAKAIRILQSANAAPIGVVVAS